MFTITPDFLLGFAAGFLITGILAFFVDLSRRWAKQIRAYRNPQAVLQFTQKSPRQVQRDAAVASTKRFLLWTFTILTLGLLVGEMLFENFTIRVARLILNLG